MTEKNGRGRPRSAENAELPIGVCFDRKTLRYYYRDTAPYLGGRKRNIPLGNDRNVAIRDGMRLREEMDLKGCRSTASKYAALYSSAKNNAKTRNIPFELTKEDVAVMLEETRGHCQLTGIAFSWKRVDGLRRRPLIPSLDRKDNSKGYTINNCRIVCAVVNLALNEFGDKVLLLMIDGFLKKNYSTSLKNLANSAARR